MTAKKQEKLARLLLTTSLSMSLGMALYTQQPATAVSQTLFEQGCDQMARKSFREAVATLTEVIASNDNDYNAIFRRGQCFYCLQNIPLALSDFDRAIHLENRNYQFYLWRGSAYAKIGKDDQAINDYEKAVRLNPSLIEAYNSQPHNDASIPTPGQGAKGETISLGNSENAVKDYSEAIKRATTKSVGYFLPGSVYNGVAALEAQHGDMMYPGSRDNSEILIKDHTDYFTLKNPTREFQERTQVIDVTPEKAVNYFERARAFEQLGHNPDAQQDFIRAVEIEPKNITYLLGRAFFYHQQGKDDLANADIARAQALDPNLPRTISFEKPKQPSTAQNDSGDAATHN